MLLIWFLKPNYGECFEFLVKNAVPLEAAIHGRASHSRVPVTQKSMSEGSVSVFSVQSVQRAIITKWATSARACERQELK